MDKGLAASGYNKGDGKAPRPPVNPARAIMRLDGREAGAYTPTIDVTMIGEVRRDAL